MLDMVRPNTSDPDSDDDTPASPPRKITAKMVASNTEDTLMFLEAHPQLANKHLKTATRRTNRHYTSVN